MASDVSGRPVCVVVVNWNGWRDTIVCLRSLFALTGHPTHIVVVDNGSTDGSAEHLSRWLDEEASPPPDAVHVLCLPKNLGYAGALNRGIAWAREKFGARSFWLLNNDIRVEPDALRSLVEAHDAVPDAGLCGSVLLEWDQPATVQAIGGAYSKVLAVGRHLRELPRLGPPDSQVCLDVDYPVGASLFVEQDYLDKVGPMDAGYFLYYEEMDWVERGRRQGFRPVIALGSRLFHKEGASTGSHGGARGLSMLSERYGVVNRLRITRKLWLPYLPLVWLSLWAVVLDRLAHREGKRAALVLRLMFSPSLWLRG